MPVVSSAGAFKHPRVCPYQGSSHPELCALHDELFFGTWRKMNAGPIDIKKAYNKLKRFLIRVKEIAWDEDLQPAKLNVKKAFDSLADAAVDEDPYHAVRMMDRALSFAHHAINDLLHEKGEKPHDPGEYEKFYDITDLPFREEL